MRNLNIKFYACRALQLGRLVAARGLAHATLHSSSSKSETSQTFPTSTSTQLSIKTASERKRLVGFKDIHSSIQLQANGVSQVVYSQEALLQKAKQLSSLQDVVNKAYLRIYYLEKELYNAPITVFSMLLKGLRLEQKYNFQKHFLSIKILFHMLTARNSCFKQITCVCRHMHEFMNRNNSKTKEMNKSSV